VSLPGAARQGDMASRNTVLPMLLCYEEHAILAGAGDAAGHLLVPLYYRVLRAGTIFLEVTVNGDMVRGCPLSVLVQAGTACAQTSEIAPDLRPRSRLVVTAGELADSRSCCATNTAILLTTALAWSWCSWTRTPGQVILVAPR